MSPLSLSPHCAAQIRESAEGAAGANRAPYTADMDRLWTPWRYAYVTGARGEGARPGVPKALQAWSGDCHCVFCNMLAATADAVAHGMSPQEADRAAYIVSRGPTCFLVLNAYPYNAGHVMAVPYQHQASLCALPEETASELMLQTRRLEFALRKVYKPHGINIGLNLGEAAGAGVAQHLHLHAVPRWSGDTNYMTVLGETRILAEMLETTFDRLQNALQEISQHEEEP